jgi:hypothetical protein
MNLGDIKIRIKRQFGDESGVQVTDDDIIRWTNDAMREIAQANDLLETISTTPSVMGQAEYTLPADILTLRAIRYGEKKLEGMSLAAADERITKYQNPDAVETGGPEFFWIWANRFTLYPAPDANDSDNIKVYYTRLPVDVAVDTDIPELHIKYHPRIVEYVLQQAYEMDEDWAASGNKNAQLVAGLNILKDSDAWTERSVYPMITVLPEDDVSAW